ncbi:MULTISPECIES: acyl-CoA carboxylase epsilon subunit [Streptomycetaceae]|uniref:acyl-CoA carboxylase epsilon subunit n=1 Tax=unclassified Streptomyces TaxID=2593676 RepID=UPI0033FFC834
MSTATGPVAPPLRVVHGSPTPDELAAVVAVLLAVLQHPGPAGSGGAARAPWRRAESPPSSRVSWREGR